MDLESEIVWARALPVILMQVWGGYFDACVCDSALLMWVSQRREVSILSSHMGLCRNILIGECHSTSIESLKYI